MRMSQKILFVASSHAHCECVARRWAVPLGGWEEGLIVQQQSPVNGEPSVTPGATVASVHATEPDTTSPWSTVVQVQQKHGQRSFLQMMSDSVAASSGFQIHTALMNNKQDKFSTPSNESTLARTETQDWLTGGNNTGINCEQMFVYVWWRTATRDRKEEEVEEDGKKEKLGVWQVFFCWTHLALLAPQFYDCS